MDDDAPARTEQVRLVEQIAAIAERCQCVIIVPPFASVARPALGPHILQRVARQEGLSVGVLYANLIFARMVSVELYERICEQTNRSWLIGERIFARAAYGLNPLGVKGDLPFTGLEAAQENPYNDNVDRQSSLPKLAAADLERIERETLQFCKIVSSGLSKASCTVVGATSSFEQTNASLAVLRSVKGRMPGARTLIGGANCEADMGPAMLDLASGTVDLVFSGESEQTFPAALKAILRGDVVRRQVIDGIPYAALDEIPLPDFNEYFAQLSLFLPTIDQNSCWLMYETSRGCWWGQKHHCTFCGLNGESMAFRQKSVSKVINDVQQLFETYSPRQLAMTDNIMPHSYHRTLLPQLSSLKRDGGIVYDRIFYEQKSNLNLDQVKGLRDAGVCVIQPGIEALSTSLLRLMKKGVSASQNIGLLRYSRVCNVGLSWNMLTEFPNDSAESFEHTLRIIPALRHLNPPSGISPLSIDRFSPYFDRREEYGISNLRPWRAYFDVFPEEADVSNLAYHFEGDYESRSRVETMVMNRLEEEVVAWRNAWMSNTTCPILAVSQLDPDTYVLMDTRDASRPNIRFLTKHQARAALVELPPSNAEARWAIANSYALLIDNKSVPLAIGSYDLMSEFAGRYTGALFA